VIGVGFFTMVLFSSLLFLIHKATEACHCHMTKLPNEAFKQDEYLFIPRGQKLQQYSKNRTLKQRAI